MTKFANRLGPILEWDHSAWIRVRTRYHEGFVNDFKEWIGIRAWDPETKTWLVPSTQQRVLEILVAKHFPDNVQTLGPDPRSAVHETAAKGSATGSGAIPPRYPPPPDTGVRPAFKQATGAYARLGIAVFAPDVVVHAAYKALVFECHPDRGGKLDDFHAVQAAYAEIKKERQLA